MINLSQNQVETILQEIADGITVQRPDGSIVYANEAAARLIGVSSADELLVISVADLMQRFELFDENGQPMPKTHLPGRRALQGEEPDDTLVRFRILATGEERWSLVSARPIRDTDGQVLFAANVFHDVTGQMNALEAERVARAQAEAVEARVAFLAQASELLAQSLDYETTLRQVAQLAVPEMADWCGVDLLKEDGLIERVAVAHVDPTMVDLAYELTRRYPSDPDAPRGLYNVLRTGQPELYPEITDEMLVASARDEEHLALIRRLTLRSLIVTPLKARGRVLGALTFAWGDSGRRYSDEDVALAGELSRRAGLAVENARLYGQATQLNAELEERVAQRTEQLEQEIREHEQAEAQLRQREQQLAKAQRIAHVGSWEWDRASNKVTWSDEMYRIFNVDPESFEPSFEGVLAYYHPDDIDYVMETLRQQAMTAMEPYELYYRIIRPDGEVRVIHSRSEPIADEQGEFVRLVGTWQDVTELKTAEQALRQSEALFATVAQNIPQGAVFVIDEEGRYLVARGQALEQMGYASEELEGKLAREVLAPELADNRIPYHEAAFAGQATTEEVEINGRIYQAQTAPLTNEEGRAYAALVLSQDITERRAAEERNARLFERLRDLSRKVLSAQEEERRRLSRELHDSTGQLMTALSIHLKLLGDQVPDELPELRDELEEARELVNEAHEEIRMVSHALRPPSLETVGLNQTLKTLAEDFGRRTGLEIAYEGGEVGSLPDQVSIGFYRFLQETLSNIARHARAHTVQINLSQEEDEVSLAVEDDGVGFSMTSQLPAPSAAGGVGLLGLRERFDLLHGQIVVDSIPGQGTRVVGRCRIYDMVGEKGREG